MCVNKTHYKLAQKKPNLGFTQISCLDTQMRMLKCYQNPDSLKIEINTRIEILSGVRVNSEHLGKLLNGKNENDVLIQNATQDTSITLVANLENIKKPVGHQYFTIIVSPTDRDKMQQANVIYDNFAPCPHFCPKIYNYK